MNRYPVKRVPIYTISKEAATEALGELRKELDQVQSVFTVAVKRLLWFRDYRAYKCFGYATFSQFVNHELGRTRQWMWQHIKALPVAEYEAKLLTGGLHCINVKTGPITSEVLTGILHCNSAKPDSEPENAGAVNLGNRLVLSHKQRLEVSKLDGLEQMKVMPILMRECPGEDVETTRRIINETLGRTEAKPAHDPVMDEVFTVNKPAEEAAARIVELCNQIIDAARLGVEELYNILQSNLQSLRSAANKLK